MSDSDLPEPLRAFIRAHIADVDALEVLLVLARNRARSFDLRSIIYELRTKNLSEAIVQRHLATFRERGLIVQLKTASSVYPVLPDHEPLVATSRAPTRSVRPSCA